MYGEKEIGLLRRDQVKVLTLIESIKILKITNNTNTNTNNTNTNTNTNANNNNNS